MSHINQPTSSLSSSSNNNNNSGRIGPRAKCDQVVYEAIAKAAEIVVRSRCPIHDEKGRNNGGKNASSSRFNIEVAEVDQVRSILQRWRRSLHVPLRLDVFHQRSPNHRDLLERWCIDYVALSPNDENGNSGDNLAQLRQVCKKVVILLRTLHCLSRMLPAYKLHRRLESTIKESEGGGYYDPQHNSAFRKNSGAGGSIGFSFYASGSHDDVSRGVSGPLQRGMDDTSSFSRYNFSPVPTPYGMLHICTLYAPNAGREMTRTTSRPIAIAKDEGHCPQSCMVSDFIIQDYAEEKREKNLEDEDMTTRCGIVAPKVAPDRQNVVVPSNSNQAMSGLSLALSKECNVTINKTSQHSSQNHTMSHRSPLLRMNSLDDGALHSNSTKPTSTTSFCGSLPDPSSERGRPLEKSPRPHPFSHALSASPRHYLMERKPRAGSITGTSTEAQTNPNTNHSGEYGYAYNNIQLPKEQNDEVEVDTSSRRLSSPHPPPGSTPPFIQSPHLSPRTSPHPSTGTATGTSPPFPSNPLTLLTSPHPFLPSTKRPRGVSSNGLLLPPSSLEVLQSSPFKTVENSLLSSLSMPASSAHDMPFVGSFGSTSSPGHPPPAMRSYYNGSTSLEEREEEGDMPFATGEGWGGDTEGGIWSGAGAATGEDSAASQFALRCSRSRRLRMFDGEGGSGAPVKSGMVDRVQGQRQQQEGEDLASQLAEFRNFGASLVNLRGSGGRMGGSVEDEVGGMPTPVA